MSNGTVTKIGGLDLSSFEKPKDRNLPTADDIDRTARLPRRDPIPEKEGDDQVNIRGRMSIIRRFKALCKAYNLSHVKMLDALMDHLEGDKR